MNLYKNKKTYYLAVCCELRETLKNNHLLKNSLKIGEFLSDTDYVLVDVFEINNNVELHNGNNSVIFEVYKVNLLTLLDINKLKSFYFVGSTNNENTKKIINTPYGKSIVYISTNKITEKSKLIKDYDYLDYYNYKNK